MKNKMFKIVLSTFLIGAMLVPTIAKINTTAGGGMTTNSVECPEETR